ncbi:MAG: radical SAM protein [Chloroflexi bacterium]|nr:radical SAM protein [Chloroflexota bacterium]
MQTLTAKTIISKYRPHGWFASNYTMNVYRGCSHGCIYCDSRSLCYSIKDFDTVKAKENALIIIEKELKNKHKKGLILSGSMSDPYNPYEAKEKLSQATLKLIDQYCFGTVIITKSPLVERDIDILLSIKQHSPAIINFTTTTADDKLCRQIEPHVAPTSQRFKALQNLSSQGLVCGILMMPILPFINDNTQNIEQLVFMAAASGAKWACMDEGAGMTLRDGNREYFYAALDKDFVGIKEKYIATFARNYVCPSPNHHLNQVFQEACYKHGLLYKPADIDALILSGYKQARQLSLL